MIEEALYTHLTTHAGLTALVGDRVYPLALPGGVTLPAVTYQRISGPRERSHDGRRLAHPRYQVTVWAETYLAARAVAEQVRLALDGFVGQLGGTVQATALLEDDRELRDPQTTWVQVPIDFTIWYGEA